MKTIWKFVLPMENRSPILMPKGAKVLAVQAQRQNEDVVCLWAVVEPDMQERVERRFSVYGTGHKLPEDPGTYIGTFQLYGGSFVGHVFEVE